ncbi:MAG: hypothetical protein ACI4I1_06195 [Oscillospiraceae bacterium]
MSKTYFGRCAAVGIAGLTAMSSMVSLAMVASAEAYPTNVYEFTYGGIAATKQFAAVVNSAAINNDYVTTTESGDVFTSGFTVASLDDFVTIVSGANIQNYSSVNFDTANNKWVYMSRNALTAALTPVLPEEYAGQRDGSAASWIFYFKSKSERDAAVNTIVSKNQSEYSSKYGSARNALSTDFSQTINNYRTDLTKRVSDIRTAADKYFRENTTTPSVSVDTLGISCAGLAAGHTVYRDAATATANGGITVSEWGSNQTKYISEQVTKLNAIATQAKNEFDEMYKASNYAFDDYKYADAATCTAIKIDDSATSVVFGTHTGQFIKPSTATYTTLAGGTLDLTDCYYRTTGDYVNSKSYAFTGEIIAESTRNATTVISAYLLDSNRWSDFSAVIEGKPNDNDNTTESGNSSNKTDDKETTTVTTWYPDSAAYRAASEVSYLGKNGSWYTSASAASLYGGGYTGTSKNSNYTSVNSSADGKAIYFDSTNGSYTTTATSYSYVVKEASSTTNDDPYYTYIFGNKNNNTTTTTVPAGSPAINGASKYAGWTNISYYITNKAKSGASYTINMNDGTIVPAAVLAAAKTKNVTLTFANDNGSKITVKPGKVSTTSDLDVEVKYNVKDVKTSLVNKAKKINAGTVSTAQVRIGEDGSLGGTVTANVKFSTKRAGCTVKAYRLSESGSLVKQATGTVSSTGRVNLNLTKGGSYLLVVIDD